MLRGAISARAVEAATDLAGRDPDLRAALLDRYAALSERPYRLDPGGEVRAAIIRGLEAAPTVADLPLLESAVRTYEFLPPKQEEVAGRLRAAALVAMAAIDADLAALHAVRLALDAHTSEMSGEPALTAIRTLAAIADLASVYAYLLAGRPHPDVIAEGLRAMAPAPPAIVDDLVQRLAGTEHEVVLLGLFDLVLGRRDRARFEPFLRTFLDTTNLLDSHRYLCAALVAARDEVLLEALRAHRAIATGAKREAADEALAIAG